MKDQINLYAIMEKQPDGAWNIVGVYSPLIGHMPCVSSHLHIVQHAYDTVIDPKVRARSQVVAFTGTVEE